MSGTINPLIANNFYSNIYFSNITNIRMDNIYFIASKKVGDNQNLYFMNHQMQIERRLKPQADFDPNGPKYKMTEQEVNNIAFIVVFSSSGGKRSNKMSIYKLTLNNVVVDGKIFPRGAAIPELQNVFFIRNEVKQPCQGFKIVKQYAGGSTGVENRYLEIDFSKADTTQKGYAFKRGEEITQKFKHTFYFIPFLCPFEENSDKYSRGFNCLWRTKI
jgi:hypothetical protein